MNKWHITKNGEPRRCKAQAGACPLGGQHFANEDDAREAYESDMRDQQVARAATKDLNDTLASERRRFADNPEHYTLIDTATGSVFSANSVVMEEPEGDDAFYETPGNFVGYDAEFNVQPLASVTSLDSYRKPVIVELDTGLVMGAQATSLYAVDHGNEIVDFEDILESDRAARECAENQGFPLWD